MESLSMSFFSLGGNSTGSIISSNSLYSSSQKFLAKSCHDGLNASEKGDIIIIFEDLHFSPMEEK